MSRALWMVLALTLHLPAAEVVQAQMVRGTDPIVVASKPFGESYILAEMFAQLLEARGIRVERMPGLGSTEILIGALRGGSVDVYPEYTGTGLLAILNDTLPRAALADTRRVYAHVDSVFQARWGMRWLPPLGFQNTFAIAVGPRSAREYGLRTLSDLARESAVLTAGFTPDFIERQDGLAGLVEVYGPGIRPRTITPLLPALKYQALAAGSVDVVDGYSTDGMLARYGLIVLEDDLHFFPPYEAAALLSAGAAARADVVSALTLLSGRLDEARMRELNRRVEVDGEDVRDVAASALSSLGLRDGPSTSPATNIDRASERSLPTYMWERRAVIGRLTLRHMLLVSLALLAAALVAIPGALVLERARRGAAPALGVLGVLQTVPSIALLAFLVPVMGIGIAPALVALWLYALYPIARGTYTGVRDADPAAVEAAEALGMTPAQRLLHVRLPLAAPVIMAGVRTAAVITVGAATLAAFIGAGGLGEPIVTGLALADNQLILSGALPAAALALIVDGLLAFIERRIAPAHLRGRGRARKTAPVEMPAPQTGPQP